MSLKSKKKILLSFITFLLIFNSCATYYLSVKNPSQLTGETKPHTLWLTLGNIPINSDIKAADVCPGQKIGGIQSIYPSTSRFWLNYFVCVLTFSLACPRSIGIECVD